MIDASFPLQMLGSMETSNGVAEAMFCRDRDRPNEGMIQWYGQGIEAGGVLVKISANTVASFELRPATFYFPDPGGGLIAPARLENFFELQKCRAYLHRTKTGLTGHWTDMTGVMRSVEFMNPPKQRKLRSVKLKDWAAFKAWASHQRRIGEFVDFRGHGSNQFSLTSTLHRSGRARMERFCYETVPRFRGQVEAILDIRLRASDSDDFSVVLGLAQHHGLPTPLLDWTASPYVAAFFAFADALENMSNRKDHTHVRIYGLSREVSVSQSSISLTYPYPHASYLDITPRKNPRLLAQQGRFLVTNIVDLEGHFRSYEKATGRKVITAVDVPIRFAAEALEDLFYMGLTAATMFPGLDGVCRMFKHEMLFRQEMSAGLKSSGQVAPVVLVPEQIEIV